MPAKKRKLIEALSKASPSGFFVLPSEVRQQIYIHLYGTEAQDGVSEHDLVRDELRRWTKTKRTTKARTSFERSRCKKPFSHQSLLLTCRQSYLDVWPLYIAFHSLAFNRPVKFANDFLSFRPPEQLSMIKHLSLRAGDMMSCYSPTLPGSVRNMVNDFNSLFDHYPDVFSNLLSFTWELSDQKSYSKNRSHHERMMHDALTERLYEQHKQERRELGVEDDMQVPDGMQLTRWRTGLVAQRREITGNKATLKQEYRSLLFMERLSFDCSSCVDEGDGLRYIDVATWLREPLEYSGDTIGMRIRSHVTPLSGSSVLGRWDRRHARDVTWSEARIDAQSSPGVLGNAIMIDVGIASTDNQVDMSDASFDEDLVDLRLSVII